jgi:hypothetical protein
VPLLARDPLPWPKQTLAQAGAVHDDLAIEPPIEHSDVTTIIGLLGDIREKVGIIRQLLEEDDGEEEDPEADP